MNDIEQSGGDEQIQHGIKRFRGGPTTVNLRHFEENLDGPLDPTGQIPINSDNIAEEVVGEVAVPLGLDSGDDNLDVVEQTGFGEVVDDESEERLIGFVVLAFGVVV